jgi:hypothetical protein
MFVVTSINGLSCVLCMYFALCWEMGTNSVDRA